MMNDIEIFNTSKQLFLREQNNYNVKMEYDLLIEKDQERKMLKSILEENHKQCFNGQFLIDYMDFSENEYPSYYDIVKVEYTDYISNKSYILRHYAKEFVDNYKVFNFELSGTTKEINVFTENDKYTLS